MLRRPRRRRSRRDRGRAARARAGARPALSPPCVDLTSPWQRRRRRAAARAAPWSDGGSPSSARVLVASSFSCETKSWSALACAKLACRFCPIMTKVDRKIASSDTTSVSVGHGHFSNQIIQTREHDDVHVDERHRSRRTAVIASATRNWTLRGPLLRLLHDDGRVAPCTMWLGRIGASSIVVGHVVVGRDWRMTVCGSRVCWWGAGHGAPRSSGLVTTMMVLTAGSPAEPAAAAYRVLRAIRCRCPDRRIRRPVGSRAARVARPPGFR